MRAVYRIKKINAGGSGLSGCIKHIEREFKTPNIAKNPAYTNYKMYGHENELDAIYYKLGINTTIQDAIKNGGANYKIRKNSVLAVEHIITTSHDFFFDKDSTVLKDNKKADLFFQKALEFMKDTYGKNLLCAVVHLDEQTPHMHAVTLPIKENKLQARNIYTRDFLRKCQTNIANYLKPLGIKRGIENSQAKHISVKQYQNAVNSSFATAEEIVDKMPLTKKNKIKKILPLTAKTTQAELELDKRKALESKIEHYESKIKELQAQTDALRELPLKQVVDALNYKYDERKKLYETPVGKISIDDSEHKFFNFNTNKGGYGAIDLIMHCNNASFNDSKKFLLDRFGNTATAAAVMNYSKHYFEKEKKQKPVFNPPIKQENDISKKNIIRYLIMERALDKNLVFENMHNGNIYVDKFNNCVFLMKDENGKPVGAELRGTAQNSTFKGCALNTDKSQGSFKVGNSGNVFLCESAIDALSLHNMQKRRGKEVTCISTAGIQIKTKKIENIIKTYKNKKIYIAFDNDEYGNIIADKLIKQFPGLKRAKPQHDFKDWNDNLKYDKNFSEEIQPEFKPRL